MCSVSDDREAVCERCRSIVSQLDDAFIQWESRGDVDDQGRVVAVCDGCLTGQEGVQIVADFVIDEPLWADEKLDAVRDLVRERLADDPAQAAQILFHLDDVTILRGLEAELLQHLAKTGIGDMLEQAIENDLDRQDAGAEPLRSIPPRLTREENLEILSRTVDALIERFAE